MDAPITVLQYVKSLLPDSYMSNVTSFCIIPDIPSQAQRPEIAVTTKHGEFVEFKDRRVQRSCIIKENVQITEIILHHAKKITNTPTYILKSEKKVFIVGDIGSDNLNIINTFSDVARIELDDVNSTGEVSIRLWLYDDAIPVMLNGEYKVTEDENFAVDVQTERDDERFASLLKSKMSEARLNTACNVKLYEEKKKFRQEIMLVSEDASRYGDANEDDAKVNRLSAGDVWQRIHCGKWVIGLPLENVSDRPISDMELLTKCNDSYVFSYETHIYQEDEAPPFWIKKRREVLHPKSSVTMIVIAEEPQFVTSASETLHAAVRYKFEDRTLSFSLPKIEIKAISLVNEEMNPVLSKYEKFGSRDILAILATSVQTKLDIHYVDDTSADLQTFLVEELKFSQNSGENSILRHCGSSLHVLHGVALYVSRDTTSSMFNTIVILSRSENQVLMLINLIYDLLPVRCIIVPSGYIVRRKYDIASSEKASEKMDVSQEMSYDNAGSDLLEYASVINKQMSAVSQHLEKCLAAMSEINARNFSSKGDASMNIDVTALGVDKFKELWQTMIENMIVRNDLLNKILTK